MITFDPAAKISAHFSHREIIKSQLADEHDIANAPSSSVLDNAKIVSEMILEPIRIHFGIGFSPNSWFRSEQLERILCANSYAKWCKRKKLDLDDPMVWARYFSRKSHPTGQAVDIEIPGVPNDVLFEWIHENIPDYDQLIREFPRAGDPDSGWVHVSFNPNSNRHSKFQIP